MGEAAAKKGDLLEVEHETHPIQIGNTMSTGSFDFKAEINEGLSPNVNIMGYPAAKQGSTANHNSSHIADPGPTGTITPKETGVGKISGGSSSVNINGLPAARHGSPATGCDNASPPNQNGKVVVKDVGNATVFIGD